MDQSIFCAADGYGGTCTAYIGHRGEHTGSHGKFSHTYNECGAPCPDRTYFGCDRPAAHKGDHAVIGYRWPQPEVGELDEGIRAILDEALEAGPRSWEQARFPVIVTTTTKHIVWIEADDADQALARLQGDGEWYEHISPETEAPDGHDYEIERPSDSDWDHIYERGITVGPARHCGECDATAHAGYPDGVPHEPDCPTLRPRVAAGAAVAEGGES